MIQHYRHIIIFSLLLSYLFLGFAGTLETLTFITFGINPQHITKSANTTPSNSKVHWTQYKHIPSIVRISVPSPAIFIQPELQHVYLYFTTATYTVSSALSGHFLSSHSSRAPPQI